MHDEEKIIIMTKLALYERSHAEKDKEINNYFKHDYVYKKNTWTRFFVVLGGFLILILKYLYKFGIEKIDPFQLDYAKEASDAIFFLIFLIVVYTVIGTVICSKEYETGRRRLARYQKMLRSLYSTHKPADKSGEAHQ